MTSRRDVRFEPPVRGCETTPSAFAADPGSAGARVLRRSCLLPVVNSPPKRDSLQEKTMVAKRSISGLFGGGRR